MKLYLVILLSFFISAVFAYEKGDVIFTNRNLNHFENDDAIQFELRTNGNGLVHTKVLSAIPPLNQHVLTKWDFSDQTIYFDIYIRNLSKGQLDYVYCHHEHISYHRDTVLYIDGFSDGKTVGCKISTKSI